MGEGVTISSHNEIPRNSESNISNHPFLHFVPISTSPPGCQTGWGATKLPIDSLETLSFNISLFFAVLT